MVLIQGIIELFFEDGVPIAVGFFKTDRVKTAHVMIDRYKVQLEYYAEALFRLTGKRVEEKIIYSFCLSEEIIL